MEAPILIFKCISFGVNKVLVLLVLLQSEETDRLPTRQTNIRSRGLNGSQMLQGDRKSIEVLYGKRGKPVDKDPCLETLEETARLRRARTLHLCQNYLMQQYTLLSDIYI